MTLRTNQLFKLAKDISERPQMFAATPEVAHGLIEALTWVILHESLDSSLGKCMAEARNLIRKATEDVYVSDVSTALLCDASFPDRVSTFNAFRSHSERLIDLIAERLCVSTNERSVTQTIAEQGGEPEPPITPVLKS